MEEMVREVVEEKGEETEETASRLRRCSWWSGDDPPA